MLFQRVHLLFYVKVISGEFLVGAGACLANLLVNQKLLDVLDFVPQGRVHINKHEFGPVEPEKVDLRHGFPLKEIL